MTGNNDQRGEKMQGDRACVPTQEKSAHVLALEAMLREHARSNPSQQLEQKTGPNPLETRPARNESDQEAPFNRYSSEAHHESTACRANSEAGTNPASRERSLSARAFDALSRREYSRQELMRKLGPWAEDETVLLRLLDKLQVDGYLSDQRYVDARLHARQMRYGSQKILYELRLQGIDESLLTAAADFLQTTELARARTVWQKKFTELPQTQTGRARQWRYLQARGFGTDIIRRVMRGEGEDQ
ncbi:MAG: recombination regulator RecX [Betaproteobacteria bacterium]|nr:recombination regulator RecX [Betaproteobacteria bacterium]